MFGRNKVGPITQAVQSKLAQADKEKAVFGLSDLFVNGATVAHGSAGVDAAYSSSWIAYSCIRRLAQDASGVPLLYLSDPKDPESGVPDTHPTRRMFENPNPYFSTGEFVQWLVTMLNRRGELFIMFDDIVRPAEMYGHSDPRHWRDIQDVGRLLGWQYQHEGVTRNYQTDEIINHRLINPDRPFRGQTPLQAARHAFEIETGAGVLTANIVERGGEKAIVYQAENDLTEPQRAQALAALRARHTSINRVGRDVLLPNGVKPIDPRFIDDDLKLLDAAAAQPDKIAAVYGVPKSLLGYEDIDKFATFQGRKRMYYTDTLMPMLKGITDAFDRYFIESAHSAYKCYVRFDWDSVPAMQDDLGDKFDIAGKAHAAGLPWDVIDERFTLGLDLGAVPGSDTIMVSSTLAPLDKLLEEWAAPKPTPPPPPAAGAAPLPDTPADGAAEEGGEGADKARAPLTNDMIYKRATNARSRVQRGIRLLRHEKAMRADWRRTLQGAMVKALKAASKMKTKADVKKALAPVFDGLDLRLADLATGYHEKGALEGEVSIVELLGGKLDDAELTTYKAVHQWRPDVAKYINARRNFVVGMAKDLFKDVTLACVEAVVEGVEQSELQHIIRTRFASAPGGINRATTIARTEIGTAYNVARFTEMTGHDIKKHRWITNADELVRSFDNDDEFDHAQCNDQVVKIGKNFKSDLMYPMQDGGAAGNVINCRCETIPVRT